MRVAAAARPTVIALAIAMAAGAHPVEAGWSAGPGASWQGFYVGGNLGEAFDGSKLSIYDLSGDGLSIKADTQDQFIGGGASWLQPARRAHSLRHRRRRGHLPGHQLSRQHPRPPRLGRRARLGLRHRGCRLRQCRRQFHHLVSRQCADEAEPRDQRSGLCRRRGPRFQGAAEVKPWRRRPVLRLRQ